MKTKEQTREEFGHYWESLKAEYGRDAGLKSEVWERFIEHKIDEEELPEDARSWPMPRSTK